MQRIDAAAIETVGIPRLLLMEHAGLAVASAVKSLLPDASSRVGVCCGMGFNGGDGLAAARHLHEWGYRLCLLVAGRADRLRGEPATYATILQRLGVSIRACADAQDVEEALRPLDDCRLLIDALVGIGARGTVREPLASLISWMNRSGKPIVAIDVPSGLDADTGLVQGVAVKATVTVTFGLPKRGCLLGQGPAHSGTVMVDSITIPHALLQSAPS